MCDYRARQAVVTSYDISEIQFLGEAIGLVASAATQNLTSTPSGASWIDLS